MENSPDKEFVESFPRSEGPRENPDYPINEEVSVEMAKKRLEMMVDYVSKRHYVNYDFVVSEKNGLVYQDAFRLIQNEYQQKGMRLHCWVRFDGPILFGEMMGNYILTVLNL